MGVLETARQYIGKVVYDFGASNPDGGVSDCSGFTMRVFQKHGYTIGRTTQEQWSKGTSVSKSELKPGDLVFFKNTYNSGYKDGVSHVGIYAGNGNMVHCGSDGVVETSINSDYYKNHWLGAKRIDGASDYEYVEQDDSSSSSDSVSTANKEWGLKWWGDIVVVVFIAILLILFLFFLIKALGVDIPKVPGM